MRNFIKLIAVYGFGTLLEQHWISKKKDDYIVDGVNDFKWMLLLYFGQQLSKNNMGQRLEPSLKNNMLAFILIIARLFMVFFFCYYLGPDIYKVFNWSFVNTDFFNKTSEVHKANNSNIYTTIISWVVFVAVCLVPLMILMALCLWCHLIKRKVVSFSGSIKNRKKKCCRGIFEFLLGTTRHLVIHNMDYEQH